MHIKKNANIVNRHSKIREQTVYGDVKDDYIRKVLNHTDVPIRVNDASGRIKVHEPIPRPIYASTPNKVIIEEWYCGTDVETMVDVPNDIFNPHPYHTEQGVLIQHEIALDDLTELLDGIYLEEVGLHISIAEYDSKQGHPRFNSDIKSQVEAMSGTLIAVEVLDPRRCVDTLYANIGGAVHRVIPKRFPTPADEGVLIHIKDSSIGGIETYAYDVQELLEGSGKHGIRLYKNELDAKDDHREPAKDQLIKLQAELRGRKEKIFNDGKQEGITESRRDLEGILKQADEKVKKAEEIMHLARETKMKDRTNLAINVLKLAGAGIGIYKLYTLQK